MLLFPCCGLCGETEGQGCNVQKPQQVSVAAQTCGEGGYWLSAPQSGSSEETRMTVSCGVRVGYKSWGASEGLICPSLSDLESKG